MEAPLARGGMGRVWRARDEVLARTVAIKLLHHGLSDDPEFVERFRREALAAAKLTHPNIVAIYDTGSESRDDGSPERHFIVMEYCAGGTLADMLERDGPLSPERTGAVGRAVCDALSYAHRYGIVHRDIKPANVLLTADGTVKVGDFGIAKAAFEGGKDLTTTGSLLGTVTYISPEQAQGEEPDARSDLYSLGVVLYELLTGRPPFAGDSQIAIAMQHVREEPVPPRGIRAGIPRALETVILRSLAKQPEERYESASEMAAALEAAAGGTGTAVFRPAEPRHAPPPIGSGRPDTKWIVPVLVLVALAVAAVALLPGLLTPPGDDPGTREGGNGNDDGGARTIAIVGTDDFDPHGDDGSEHPESAGLAADGNSSTAWTTQNYNTSFELYGKPGVGLLFDLGESVEVAAVKIEGHAGSLEVRASDEPGADETAFEEVGDGSLSGSTTIPVGNHTARYWLLWITELPGGAGSADIAEAEFRGP